MAVALQQPARVLQYPGHILETKRPEERVCLYRMLQRKQY